MHKKCFSLPALSLLLCLLLSACAHKGATDMLQAAKLSIFMGDKVQDEAPVTAPAASEAEAMEESPEVSEGSPAVLDLAVLPDGSGPPAEPANDVAEPEHPVWEVERGEDLYTALARWCADTELWEVKRMTRHRWPIDANASFQAPFLDAVSRLLEAFGNHDPSPALTAYHVNHQIVIRDNSTELY